MKNKISKKDIFLILKKHLDIDGQHFENEWRLASNQMYFKNYVNKREAKIRLYGAIIDDVVNLILKESEE